MPLGRREERKVVSVLVCDLVGFTAQADQADPEEVQAGPLSRPDPAGDRALRRHGGEVHRGRGRRRVRRPDRTRGRRRAGRAAALDVIEGIDRLNQASPGLDLAVRVAVNTGEAVVSLDARPERGEHFLTGTWPTPPPGCRASPRWAGWSSARRPGGRPSGCSTTSRSPRSGSRQGGAAAHLARGRDPQPPRGRRRVGAEEPAGGP
jgi:hypothetical protein